MGCQMTRDQMNLRNLERYGWQRKDDSNRAKVEILDQRYFRGSLNDELEFYNLWEFISYTYRLMKTGKC